MEAGTYVLLGVVIFAVIGFSQTIRIVPQRSAFIVEHLGKYSKTLEAGFHILIHFSTKLLTSTP